jgi:hypothetical protein
MLRAQAHTRLNKMTKDNGYLPGKSVGRERTYDTLYREFIRVPHGGSIGHDSPNGEGVLVLVEHLSLLVKHHSEE